LSFLILGLPIPTQTSPLERKDIPKLMGQPTKQKNIAFQFDKLETKYLKKK